MGRFCRDIWRKAAGRYTVIRTCVSHSIRLVSRGVHITNSCFCLLAARTSCCYVLPGLANFRFRFRWCLLATGTVGLYIWWHRAVKPWHSWLRGDLACSHSCSICCGARIRNLGNGWGESRNTWPTLTPHMWKVGPMSWRDARLLLDPQQSCHHCMNF